MTYLIHVIIFITTPYHALLLLLLLLLLPLLLLLLLLILLRHIDKIGEKIEEWCDTASQGNVDLLLTSGGTGFGIRDNTPETVRPLLHRHAPGVAQALINEGA